MCSTLLSDRREQSACGDLWVFEILVKEMRILITISPALNKIIYTLLLLPPHLQKDLSAAVW